jgi:hypothetical protein
MTDPLLKYLTEQKRIRRRAASTPYDIDVFGQLKCRLGNLGELSTSEHLQEFIVSSCNESERKDQIIRILDEALENIKKWSIDGGNKLAAKDPRHPLIGHMYEFERSVIEARQKVRELVKESL